MGRTLKLWEKAVAVFSSIALVVTLCPAVALADPEGSAATPPPLPCGWLEQR